VFDLFEVGTFALLGTMTATLKRIALRGLLPADIWERHMIVARLAGKPRTAIDVGGVTGQLEAFMPATEVVTVNVEPPTDVLFDGEVLPFPDRSFDLAVSLDVLEHIERGERLQHFRELARVARERVLLCCPLGTPEHVEAERDLAEWRRSRTGTSDRYLEEHVERGLPTEEELRELASAAGLRFELRFSGDFRVAVERFRAAVEAESRGRRSALTRRFLDAADARRNYQVEPSSGPFTNRAFLVGHP
jgi:SAM-dependent methyltransferase